jgi:hypothetical protein
LTRPLDSFTVLTINVIYPMVMPWGSGCAIA